MAKGINGRILSTHSKNDIKVIDAIFESNGIQYNIQGLKLALNGKHQTGYRIYMDGKCFHNNVEYEKVSLRVIFSQQFPLTHHLTLDDFANQEAYLYIDWEGIERASNYCVSPLQKAMNIKVI